MAVSRAASLRWVAIAVLVIAAAIAAPYAITYYYASRHVPGFLPPIADGIRGHRVTVRFDSLTVHRTHEGFLSGDAEYDVVAYVQGVKVKLTDLSRSETSGYCAGWWCGGYPMLDASEAETFTFDPKASVTVDLGETIPLSIFTVGVEVDGCGRRPFPEVTEATLTPPGLTLPEIFKNPALDWYHAVDLFQSFAMYRVMCIAVNGNDPLGSINKFYDPPTYSAGAHSDLVSAADFTLQYTINASEIPPVILQ